MKSREIKMEQMQAICESYTGKKVVKRKCRKQDNIRMKSAIAVMACKHFGYGLANTAEFLGHKTKRGEGDHTCTIHYRDTHPYRYRDDEEYRHLYDHLRREVCNVTDNSVIMQLIKSL